MMNRTRIDFCLAALTIGFWAGCGDNDPMSRSESALLADCAGQYMCTVGTGKDRNKVVPFLLDQSCATETGMQLAPNGVILTKASPKSEAIADEKLSWAPVTWGFALAGKKSGIVGGQCVSLELQNQNRSKCAGTYTCHLQIDGKSDDYKAILDDACIFEDGTELAEDGILLKDGKQSTAFKNWMWLFSDDGIDIFQDDKMIVNCLRQSSTDKNAKTSGSKTTGNDDVGQDSSTDAEDEEYFGDCEGYASSCTGMDMQSCVDQIGCYPHFSQTSYGTLKETCWGTADRCSSLGSKTLCNMQRGCLWQPN